MVFDFNSDTPIYIQVAEEIENAIISARSVMGRRRLPQRKYLSHIRSIPRLRSKALGGSWTTGYCTRKGEWGCSWKREHGENS